MRKFVAGLVLAFIACSAAIGQAPSLMYQVFNSVSTPIGDGTKGSQPLQVSATLSANSKVQPTQFSSTDISGTVTAGNSYQTVAALSVTRHNCTIQNPASATENLNIKLGTMAQPYVIAPGEGFSSTNAVVAATDAITLTAATTGHAFAGNCQ